MRKIVLFSLCFVSLLVNAQDSEQTTEPNKWAVGIKAGIHNSSVKYSKMNWYNTERTNSGSFSIFAEYSFSEKSPFLLRPELAFHSKGIEIEEPKKIEYSLSANHVDFRLPIIYQFNRENTFIPYFYAAPVVNIATGGEITMTEYRTTGSVLSNQKYKTKLNESNFSSFNLGAMVGAGVKVPVKISDYQLNIGAEAAYYHGFSDTYGSNEKNGKANVLNIQGNNVIGDRKFSGWELSATVSIPLGQKKQKKKEVVPIIPRIVVEEPAPPAPVVVEEEPDKPCYTLEEINDLVLAKKTIVGKTICAINQINFEFGKSSLDKVSAQYLDKIVTLLKMSPIKMEIIGHTDNVGSESFNLDLSKKRAEAVHNYLLKSGVHSSLITYNYFGMSKPIESNDTEEGRLRNRRVEFLILDK